MRFEVFHAPCVRWRSLTSWWLLTRVLEKLLILSLQWLEILGRTLGTWWSVDISSKYILFGGRCLNFIKGSVLLRYLLWSIFVLLVLNIILCIDRDSCLCCSKVVTDLRFVHQELCLAGRNFKCTLWLRDVQAHIRLSHFDIHKTPAVHLGGWVNFSRIH
jgi:hypothetical protein